jgi:hypothetical protein
MRCVQVAVLKQQRTTELTLGFVIYSAFTSLLLRVAEFAGVWPTLLPLMLLVLLLLLLYCWDSPCTTRPAQRLAHS